MLYLVDDDTDDIMLFKEGLSRAKYNGQLNMYSNGVQLMDSLTHSSSLPDAILLDINMPLKSGIEALSEIKSNPVLKSIPVFMLTSSTSEAVRRKCIELGCDLFWTKPTTVEEQNSIVNFIVNFLNNRPAQTFSL